jgi:hypothetical protein
MNLWTNHTASARTTTKTPLFNFILRQVSSDKKNQKNCAISKHVYEWRNFTTTCMCTTLTFTTSRKGFAVVKPSTTDRRPGILTRVLGRTGILKFLRILKFSLPASGLYIYIYIYIYIYSPPSAARAILRTSSQAWHFVVWAIITRLRRSGVGCGEWECRLPPKRSPDAVLV